MLIKAQGLKKSFGPKVVLKDVSFEVEKGEVLGIIGKNGSGKTVLMNILVGLLEPDYGQVFYQGKLIDDDIFTYRENVNFASSYQSLQIHASVYENLVSFGMFYGVDDIDNKIKSLLELVELPKSLWNKKIFRLSSGESSRVNLAKGMLNNPEILYLDEPTAFMDPIFKDRLQLIINKIKKEYGTCVIMTSHDLSEISRLCDRVLFLDDGKVTELKDKSVNYQDLLNHFLKT